MLVSAGRFAPASVHTPHTTAWAPPVLAPFHTHSPPCKRRHMTVYRVYLTESRGVYTACCSVYMWGRAAYQPRSLSLCRYPAWPSHLRTTLPVRDAVWAYTLRIVQGNGLSTHTPLHVRDAIHTQYVSYREHLAGVGLRTLSSPQLIPHGAVDSSIPPCQSIRMRYLTGRRESVCRHPSL